MGRTSGRRLAIPSVFALLLLMGGGVASAFAAPSAVPLAAGVSHAPAPLSPAGLTVQRYNTTVPAKYESNYTTLTAGLAAFNASLGSYPAITNTFSYAASLVPADGNRGTSLFQTNNQGSLTANLDALQAMGVREVEISIPYPLLDPTFPNSSQYLAYYTQLVQNVHSRGMKVLIESHVVFAGTGFSSINYSFRGMPYSEFVTKAIAQNQLIIDKIKPEYLDIGTEADTEAALTGYHQLDTPSGWTGFIEQQLSSLNRTGSPTKICAGAGTWLGVQFLTGFASDPRLDFLTTHVYPIYGNNLQVLVQMAQVAQQNNKRLVISEGWSETVTVPSPPPGTGVGGPFADHQELWGFSSNVDVPYLELMARFCSIYPVELYSAFSEQYFFAYLNYTPQLDSMDYFTLDSQINQIWAQNMRTLTVTPTGAEYASLAQGAAAASQTSSTTTSAVRTATTTPATTTATTATTSAATTPRTTSSTTTPPVLTTATPTVTTTGGGVPEFPLQLVAVTIFTTVLVVSYLAVRARSGAKHQPSS